MPDTVDERTKQPLDEAESEQLRALAAGIVTQARNFGVAIGRDPDLVALAVITRAAAEVVCDAAGLEATPDQLARQSTSLAGRIVAASVNVQLERHDAGGTTPNTGEDDEAEAFTPMEGDQ